MRFTAAESPLVGRREEPAAIDAVLAGDALGLALVGEPGSGLASLSGRERERA